MTHQQPNWTKKVASKIVGIQFSVLSPEEIRKCSVAEITSRDTYSNNIPVIGGMFDPRLGVLEPGLKCPTDGLDYIRTPGYFGHIELAKPVFYYQYLLLEVIYFSKNLTLILFYLIKSLNSLRT
jgi:DNA-directed RNA polymerase II subunit RPB1